MANQIPKEALAAIEDAVRRNPNGVSAPEILRALAAPVPPRTLQYRLKHLVTRNRIVMDGEGRWARYRMPDTAIDAVAREDTNEPVIPLSEVGTAIRDYVRQAPEARKPVGYDRKFLDRYRPNASFYLTQQDRAHLATVGRPQIAEQPAGTYAKLILSRLLIDLSWNSSRLEGNTYSLLDTKRLIELGEEAVGRAHLEAQMILNHKDAIEFLVGAADEIGFNRYTLLNLHALLAALSGERLLLYPPLVVIGFEMFAHTRICPWARRPLVLPLACALTAAAGVFFVSLLGAGPFAAVLSMAFGVVMLRILALHVPPALAVGLLPFVMVHPTYGFPIAVAIGTFLLILSFLMWQRLTTERLS